MAEHGNCARYNAGCRCALCKSANRERVAAWKAANPDRALAQRQRKRAKERAAGTRSRQKREATATRQLLAGPRGFPKGDKMFYRPADVDRWLSDLALYERKGIRAVIERRAEEVNADA